jgi:hypothetical protein
MSRSRATPAETVTNGQALKFLALRLSRRFYSTLAPPESPRADQLGSEVCVRDDADH